MTLNYDLLEAVFDKCDFLTQIRMRQTTGDAYTIQMTDFYNNMNYIKRQLNDNIVLLYPHIKKLDANQNTLAIRSKKPITQNAIRNLHSLVDLNVSYNHAITDLNHLSQLRSLSAIGTCIDQTAISNLYNLIRLDVSYNSLVYDINHMKQLRALTAYGWCCALSHDGIRELRELTHISFFYNDLIKDLSQLSSIESVSPSGKFILFRP